MTSYSWYLALGQGQVSVNSVANNFEVKSKSILLVLIVELFWQCKIKSSVVERLLRTCFRPLMCSFWPPTACIWYLEPPVCLSCILVRESQFAEIYEKNSSSLYTKIIPQLSTLEQFWFRLVCDLNRKLGCWDSVSAETTCKKLCVEVNVTININATSGSRCLRQTDLGHTVTTLTWGYWRLYQCLELKILFAPVEIFLQLFFFCWVTLCTRWL